MSCFLGDLNARARGLRTHLLKRAELDRLARLPSLFALERELSALGLLGTDGPSSARQLERSLRRHAAAQIKVLAQWSRGRREAVLAVVLLDEDRRSIQTLLRGAADAAAPAVRMADLIPTEQLPERALRSLAEQPTVTDVVRLLLLFKHPLAGSMAAAAGGARPSLFRIEVELGRAFAEVALRDAQRGGRHLHAYAQESVDLMNVYAALLHFPERDPSLRELAFIDGGHFLGPDDFEAMMRLQTSGELPAYLGQLFKGSALSAVFEAGALDLSSLEARVLQAQIDAQRKAMLRDPLGAAAILGFVLELRAQMLDLRRILWGITLQAPPALLYGDQVSA